MPERILWPGPETRGFLCLLSKFAETLMRARRHRSFCSNPYGFEDLKRLFCLRCGPRCEMENSGDRMNLVYPFAYSGDFAGEISFVLWLIFLS